MDNGTGVLIPRADALFIAGRLHSYGKRKQKAVDNAISKSRHPELIRKMQEDVAECARIVATLQRETAT